MPDFHPLRANRSSTLPKILGERPGFFNAKRGEVERSLLFGASLLPLHLSKNSIQ